MCLNDKSSIIICFHVFDVVDKPRKLKIVDQYERDWRRIMHDNCDIVNNVIKLKCFLN